MLNPIPQFHSGSNDGVTNGSIHWLHGLGIALTAATATAAAVGTVAYSNGLKTGVQASIKSQEDTGTIPIDLFLHKNLKKLGVKTKTIGMI